MKLTRAQSRNDFLFKNTPCNLNAFNDLSFALIHGRITPTTILLQTHTVHNKRADVKGSRRIKIIWD